MDFIWVVDGLYMGGGWALYGRRCLFSGFF
jgi:hypothetical protein